MPLSFLACWLASSEAYWSASQRFEHQRERPGGRPHGRGGRPDRPAWLVPGIYPGRTNCRRPADHPRRGTAGSIADFVPSSVIKGLLAAIGLILILKQMPHLLGHDADVEGEMSFQQPDQENTFSELVEMVSNIHPGQP